MVASQDGHVRLVIDVDLELQHRLERGAVGRELSVSEYVVALLRSTPDLEGSQTLPDRGDPPNSLSHEDQRRGLTVLEELERLRTHLSAQHGQFVPESWELLNASREERTRNLMQAAEE